MWAFLGSSAHPRVDVMHDARRYLVIGRVLAPGGGNFVYVNKVKINDPRLSHKKHHLNRLFWETVFFDAKKPVEPHFTEPCFTLVPCFYPSVSGYPRLCPLSLHFLSLRCLWDSREGLKTLNTPLHGNSPGWMSKPKNSQKLNQWPENCGLSDILQCSVFVSSRLLVITTVVFTSLRIFGKWCLFCSKWFPL